MQVTLSEARSLLVRSSGYLTQVSSHSLNPYRGCSFGKTLCGVSCYVRHNGHVCRGRNWGEFLEIKTNAAACYLREAPRERRWCGRQQQPFSIFMASSTDPYLPQERSHRITRSVLQAMLEEPPDQLVLQTHSCLIVEDLPLLERLHQQIQVRVHISIESDREVLPGLPRPAFSVSQRMQAAELLRRAGLWTVATLAPLHPICDPERFFGLLNNSVDAVVIDHFILGDGSSAGQRTLRTALPGAMEAVCPGSSQLSYRDQVVEWARLYFKGRVGVGQEGFAGRYLAPAPHNKAE